MNAKTELAAIVSKATLKKTNAEWMAVMEPRGVWHAPVNDYADILNDPQVLHQECFVTVEGAGPNKDSLTFLNHPLRYDGQAAEIALPPQPLGAQTETILNELGFSPERIAALKDSKTIA